jgi:DNA (cytosine-5)-methyltransferase 1
MVKPKVISLFSGAGGMDLGFEMAGYEIVFANDIDKWAVETYLHNFKNTKVVLGDISEIPSEDIPEADVVIGGFPCQDFSVLGGSNRQGIKAKRGKLYKEFLRIIKSKKPKVFVAENVKGILSANNGLAIKIIKHDFEHLEDTNLNVGAEYFDLKEVESWSVSTEIGKSKNYYVFIDLYKFVEYGVPQIRERVVIVGIRRDIYEALRVPFVKPKPLITEPSKYVSSGDVFEGRALYYYLNVKDIPYNNEHQKIKSRTVEILKRIPEGGNYKDLPPEYSVKGLMSNIYRKLDRKKPSPTIIANGGGGTWGYHYEEPRPLTNRERARLQTFPDTFIFKGPIGEVRKQIGNAVPPLGIIPVAFQIKKYLIENYDISNDPYYKDYLNIINRIPGK